MKKIVWGVVIVGVLVAGFVFFTNSGTVAKEKVIIEETETKSGETVKSKTTITPGEIERKTEFTPGVEVKKGYLKEDSVTIKEIDENNMYVTVVKEKIVYRVKFRKDAKENLLKHRGKEVTIWSTYPLEEKTCEIVRCEPVK